MQKLSFLAVAVLSSVGVAQCIQTPGTMITILQDSIAGPNPIGFAFPFEGSTYNEIHVSDHGICFLSNNGSPAIPTATPLVYTPAAASLVLNGPVICPHWSDTIPAASGTSFWIDSQATTCTVTWFQVQSFGFPTPLMSFQLTLYDTGNIEFTYGPNVTNNSTFGGVSDNGIVGVSPGMPATLPASVDFSTSPVTTDSTTFEEFLVANTFDMAGDKILMIPASPGWVVVHMPDGAGCASSESFGVGCDNLALASSTPPVVGTNWDLTATGFNAASALGFHFFAFGRQTPALPLSALGLNAPGCDDNLPLANVIANLVGPVTSGSSTASLPIPAGSSFVGVKMSVQTIGLTSSNPAGLATSNGVEGTFGN
ncbi:MAG: hypothetical protein KDE27_14005 [Planctomycetes bacterium]|nr:hypothetical protein [Planctomycetota bacterium]